MTRAHQIDVSAALVGRIQKNIVPLQTSPIGPTLTYMNGAVCVCEISVNVSMPTA